MVTADTAWEFVYDGEVWEARCAPPCEANVSIAVETLIVGFGTRAWSVEDFLRIWDEKIATEGVGFTLNVVAATVAQVTPDDVEITDKYGQFRDVRLPATALRNALGALITAMNSRGRD
ncbi:hypothetical protein GCM10009682_43600 [Luedemannella flava]|uniref:Uncharacterized protein n=1 Tax=Luedemannella flava TaxID=349316 RepID=A0ABP4YJU0_9ACTN